MATKAKKKTTKVYKKKAERQISPKRDGLAGLTIREKKFVYEYVIDGDAPRAAIASGHTAKDAPKVLKRQHIIEAILERQKALAIKCEVQAEEVLKQLYYCCTRTAKDFIDEEGMIQTDVTKLSERAANAIDGIKQRVTYDLEGNRTVTTELKLVPKIAAVELAMKNKGLFAPKQIQSEHTHRIDWEAMTRRPEKDSSDEISALIENPRRLENSQKETIIEAKYSVRELAESEVPD